MKKILLIILAVVLIALGITAYTFKNEIKLAYNFLFVAPEKIATEHEEKKAELKETLITEFEIDEVLAEGFTEEEKNQISKGIITVEEAMERIFSEMHVTYGEPSPYYPKEPTKDSDDSEKTNSKNNKTGAEKESSSEGAVPEKNNSDSKTPSDGKDSPKGKTPSNNKDTSKGKEPESGKTPSGNKTSAAENPAVPAKNQSTESEQSKPDNKTLANQAVATATQELYRLQGSYYAQLGGLESEVIAFYNAQIKSGATQNRAKAAVISTFSGRLYAMEAQADGQVEAVLSNLTATLNSLGADTSIVSKMRSEYESQKAAKISQYRSIAG